MTKTVLTSMSETSRDPGLAKAPTGIRGLEQITGAGLPRAGLQFP